MNSMRGSTFTTTNRGGELTYKVEIPVGERTRGLRCRIRSVTNRVELLGQAHHGELAKGVSEKLDIFVAWWLHLVGAQQVRPHHCW
jgi:hypothetical protein